MAAPAPAAEAEDLTLTKMVVSVWPEYDEPSVAVMYEGEFQGATFPREVRFLIPPTADVREVCALEKPKDEHLCQPYRLTVEGGKKGVAFSLPIPTFFIQFYYNPISGVGPRQIAYSLETPYAVQELEIEVQQPLRPSNFLLNPEPQEARPDSRGFRFYRYFYSEAPQGSAYNLTATYEKADTAPSVAKAQGGQGQASTGAGPATLAIVAGGGGLGLLLLLLWRRASPAAADVHHGPSEPTAFCTGCGAPLAPGSNFCSQCGRKAAARQRQQHARAT